MIAVALLIQNAFNVAAAHNPRSQSVVVAAQELEAGTELTSSDLTEQHLPASTLPSNVVTKVDDVLGKTLAVPMPPGLPLTKTQLLGDEFLAAAPAGTSVTPLQFAGGLLDDVIKQGHKVDIYAIDPTWNGQDADSATNGQDADAATKDTAQKGAAGADAAQKGASRSGAAQATAAQLGSARLITKNAVILGKSAHERRSSPFSDVADNTVYYVAIENSDISLVIGMQAKTPLQAVLAKQP